MRQIKERVSKKKETLGRMNKMRVMVKRIIIAKMGKSVSVGGRDKWMRKRE